MNTVQLKERDARIQDLRNKIDILNKEIQLREDKINEMQEESLQFRKDIQKLVDDVTAAESQTHIYKQNLVQRDIEVSLIK